MDPFQQHTGFALLWIYLSITLVFLFGIWQTIYVSKILGISQKKAIFLYFWHTLICIAHYFWITKVGNDVLGTYIRSLDPSSSFGRFTYLPTGEAQYITNIFILNFYRIFSYYLKFSLFTTFLVINIIGNNAILLIEYFYRKLSIDFPRNIRFVFGLFLWIPTLHFWTSLGKDSLVILGILLITYSLENLKKRFLLAIPALIIVTIIRNYISIMVVLSIILSIFLNKSAIKQSSKIILLGGALLSMVFIFPLVTSFLFDGNLENFKTILETINYNSRMTSTGTYAIDPNTDLFTRIFSYIFRPLFFDARNLFGLVLSFDNFILLIIFVYSFINMIKFRCLRLSFNNQISTFCATFSFSTAFLLSISTSNLGLAARHKWMFLPVAFILFLRILRSAFIKKKVIMKE